VEIKASGPFSFTFTTALADGTYEACAITIDNANNSPTSSPVSFTIDTVSLTITRAPDTSAQVLAGRDITRRGLLGPVADSLEGALLEADAGLA